MLALHRPSPLSVSHGLAQIAGVGSAAGLGCELPRKSSDGSSAENTAGTGLRRARARARGPGIDPGSQYLDKQLPSCPPPRHPLAIFIEDVREESSETKKQPATIEKNHNVKWNKYGDSSDSPGNHPLNGL